MDTRLIILILVIVVGRCYLVLFLKPIPDLRELVSQGATMPL